jgi:Dolichyl-phosphate-mannose-protein mannosyltransferase
LAMAVVTVLSAYVQRHNDGLWFQGDAPRHAANGLFLLDLVRFLPSHPIDFALSYYARYPIIVPIAYPPLFYVLEAAAFGVTTPSPFVAKALVWSFTAVTAAYTLVWARRRLSPFAGWAGVCVVLMPSMLRYSNAVLLNVPSTAFCIAALYHFQEWLERNSARDRRRFLLLTTAALLTYYPSGIILPIAIVWMLGSKPEMVRSSTVWLVVAILAGLVVAVDYALPVFSSRMTPALSRWQNLAGWASTARNIVRAIGAWWLPIAALGLAIGMIRAGRRSEALRLAVAFPIVLVVLVVVPAESDRYALLLAPLAVLAAFLGLVTCVESARRWRRATMAGGLAALMSWSGWVALTTEIPEASGFRKVAEFVTAEGPRDSILYSGNHDGIFGLYLRMMDPGFDRGMVPTNRLLYRFQQGQRFGWRETPNVSSPADVVSMIQRQSGCRWIAVEIGSRPLRVVSEQYLRQALEGPEFELVRSFPVRTAYYGTTRVDLYRFVGTLDEPPPVDLQFPSFSPRVFRGITPIQR